MLYALFSAPLVGAFAFPVLWGLCLGLVASGWAGLRSFQCVAVALGLALVHVLLHGDVTVEAPWAMLPIAAALLVQGTVTWAAFWVLRSARFRIGGAQMGTSSDITHEKT